MGIKAGFWENWILFRREWGKNTIAAIINPILYLIVFGIGIGSDTPVSGMPYMTFLLPGIVVMSTMSNAYSSVSVTLNIKRLYEESFKQIMVSPTPLWKYMIGQVLYGTLHGVYVGCLILLAAFCVGLRIQLSLTFFAVLALGAMSFSALGGFAAAIINSHLGLSRFTNFVIVPMTFLCNTVFPVERLPLVIEKLVSVLPISCCSSILRALASGGRYHAWELIMLFVFTGLFYAASVAAVMKQKDY